MLMHPHRLCKSPSEKGPANAVNTGGFITMPQIAQEIVDTWLRTEFTQGWEKPVQEWLHNAMNSIRKIEQQ